MNQRKKISPNHRLRFSCLIREGERVAQRPSSRTTLSLFRFPAGLIPSSTNLGTPNLVSAIRPLSLTAALLATMLAAISRFGLLALRVILLTFPFPLPSVVVVLTINTGASPGGFRFPLLLAMVLDLWTGLRSICRCCRDMLICRAMLISTAALRSGSSSPSSSLPSSSRMGSAAEMDGRFLRVITTAAGAPAGEEADGPAADCTV